MKNKLNKKALNLGWPHAKLKVIIEFNNKNSSLIKDGQKPVVQIYNIENIVENGILIGNIGHLQLIEWKYVKDIY